MMPTPARAVDGTITINGEITDQTCKINGKEPPADILVKLPKISQSALKAKGDTAGATLFTISLTECPDTLAGSVKSHFEPGPTLDYDTGNLYAYQSSQPATTALTAIPSLSGKTPLENVQIQLANADGSAIKIGDDSKTKGATLVSANGKKSATLRYLARYIKSGDKAIQAGKLESYVQYSIIYP
ncbi:fimbrial protein [Bordetella genomosp. 12]|uniref:Fimbrial protein n=2 Tax=Bordetella genomosp. 12 TaxID=463035 RepID=A0A261VFJ3_9BORD|nr:fimbrial protein [Bordetella genomosp. 12]